MRHSRNPELAALLAAAAAVPREQDGVTGRPGVGGQSGPGGLGAQDELTELTGRSAREARQLGAVLAAFNAAGLGPDEAAAPSAGKAAGHSAASGKRTSPGTHAAAPRPRWMSGALAAKCATAFVLATVCGVVAAGAGVLPNPMQQLAHDALGGVGVPAPHTPAPGTGEGTTSAASATAHAMATGNGRRSAGGGSTSSAPSNQTVPPARLEALCGTVVLADKSWRDQVGQNDRNALDNAAGGDQKVVSYCALLLANSSSPVMAPPPNAATAPAAAPAPSTSPDKGHPSRSKSPDPHPNSH